jgi:Meiotically up-regulated gene 113
VTKEQILTEIIRTAGSNNGVPLGRARFEAETGINRCDWYGRHWATWGDAVREAGFTPNELTKPLDPNLLLEKYASLALELKKLPTSGDLRLKKRRDPGFPDQKSFERLGRKKAMIKILVDYCRNRQEYNLVAQFCEHYLRSFPPSNDQETHGQAMTVGYVYLIRHGSRQEYKIGRTYNRLRREGEIGIELPEKIEPIHVIETDDPSGVEAYWHRRFASKRKEGEWFVLTNQDVRAFKRWKRIY